MSVKIVRLGTPRLPGEGLRLGTVRRPPRGVPKARFAADDWYDVWFPNLAPSLATMKRGQAAESAAAWSAFTRKYRGEMSAPGGTSNCWRPCHTRRASRSAATASTNRIATGRSCASCCARRVR